MKKVFLLFSIIFFVFLSFSCKIGMGEALDLEAPKITLTLPKTKPGETTYVPRKVLLAGTATDNKGVTKIIVEYYSPDGKVKGSLNARIEGENWYASLPEMENDIELSITITAYDANDNTAETSVTGIMVCVDAENPIVKEFGIKKNGQQTTLKTLETLEGLSEYESANKDDFQNEEFTIVATLNDNYTIGESLLALYDKDGTKILADLRPDNENGPDFNRYKPSWTIKGKTIEGINATYKTGRHYFVPVITAKDGAGNIDNIQGNYLCWYPESDKPKVLFPLASADARISVGTDVKIPVDIFDDDGIANVYYKLVRSGDVVKNRDVVDAKGTFEKKRNDFAEDSTATARDGNFVINSGTVAGLYYLVVAVEDKKSIAGYNTVWGYYSILTLVSNADAPIIITTKPEENTSAALTNNCFTIKGYSLDDESVITGNSKPNNILIAWLPNGDNQETKAISLLEAFSKKTGITPGTCETDSSGIKIWKPTTAANSTEDPKFADYIKDTFEQEFNVLTDFKVGSTLKNERKFFIIYVVDKTGNVTYNTFSLNAYTESPTIKVEYSYDNTTYTPLKNASLKCSEASGTVYFRIYPKGANGLAIKNLKVEGTGITGTKELTKTSDYYIHNYQFENTNANLEFTFKAEDVLGNTGAEKKIVEFVEKATLQEITTEITDVTLIAGETLRVLANFSSEVEVTGTPYIVLSNITGGPTGSDYKAFYKDGSGTDTLIFEYKIQSGMQTSGTGESQYVGTPMSDPITIPTGASINCKPITGSFTSITNRKIKVDAVPPTIVPTSCNPKKGETIDKNATTITLEFNEDIVKDSGTITLQRTEGWAIPPVIENDKFMDIYAKVDNKDKITLMGTSSGNPELIKDGGTPVGPYKKITHGLDLSGTNAVPDTSTKYVLAFDYKDEKNLDIHNKDEGKTVQKLREVLERYGYHKTQIATGDWSVSGKNLTIKVPADWLVDGREFEVVLTKGCVRDLAGNANEEVVRGVYTFWTNGVAKPVIRVDRYTHGAGVQEPNSSGELGAVLTKTTAFTTAPTGFARVRIDCETPNATITYGIRAVEKATLNLSSPPADRTDGEGKTENIKCDDAASTTVKGISVSTSYTKNSYFTVGSASLLESGKWYIKAEANSAGGQGTQPATTAVNNAAYEGAYKTVIYSHNPNHDSISATQPIIVQGSDKAGEPLIPGFPLRDANPDERYGRVMYKITDKTDYVVISYDIVSTFRMQTYVTNWSKDGDTNCSYGWVIYNNKRNFH